MMNSSVSLISEMIGYDDQASAVVFASFNLLESLSCGGLAYVIIGFGMTESETSLKVLMFVPVVLSSTAFIISRWRFSQIDED